MHSMQSFWELIRTYLLPHRKKVIGLFLLLIGNIGFQAISPKIIGYYIDVAVGNNVVSTLILATLLYLLSSLLQQIFSVLTQYLNEVVAWTATNQLRRDLVRHCFQLDLSFHLEHTPGEMIERLEGDVTRLANVLSQFVSQILGNSLLLIGIALLFFVTDWRLGATMTVFIIGSLFLLRWLRSVGIRQWQAERQASADLSAFWEEWLAGTEDIRSSGEIATAYVKHRLPRLLGRQLRKERLAWLVGGTVRFMTIILYAASSAIIFALGSWLYLNHALSIGNLYATFFYSQLLMVPLRSISDQLHDMQQARAALYRVQELMQIQTRIEDGHEAHLPPQGALSLTCEHLYFAYEPGTPVLSDITFQLQPGQVLGVLGRTGSGKSTLARLVTRLYDPSEGTIQLASANLRQVPLKEIRDRVYVVTQEVQLFAATLRDNLTLFDASIPDTRIHEALTSLGLEEWYNRLPQGLDSILDNRGTSAGEAQLLAFARAFLRDPALVILDEASSRLDPTTEALIEHAVDLLLKDRTAIVIAHRLATVQRANQILILEKGVIREYGERTQLVKNPASHFSHLLRTSLEASPV